jgi:hypothetical protein
VNQSLGRALLTRSGQKGRRTGYLRVVGSGLALMHLGFNKTWIGESRHAGMCKDVRVLFFVVA